MSQEILQQLLNRSVAHIRKQGKPSLADDGRLCLYRNPDGRGCGAAPFITQYDPKMEKTYWWKVTRNWSAALDRDAVEHADFVEDVLQNSHDEAASRAKDDSDFLKEYEREVERNIDDWNGTHEMSLTIPPVGWEVV